MLRKLKNFISNGIRNKQFNFIFMPEGFQKGHKVFGGFQKGNTFGFKKGENTGENNFAKRPEVRKKISEAMKGNTNFGSKGKFGKDSIAWKGGRTSLDRIIRNCFKYRQWRSDIFTRDDWTCQNCGIKNHKGLGKTIKLHPHHIKKFSMILEENNIKTMEESLNCEELWNLNNGLTLCYECHLKRHLHKF